MNGTMMMMLQKLPTLLMATFKLAGREKFQRSHKSWLSKYLLQFSFPPAWREQNLGNKNISNRTMYSLTIRSTFSVDKVMASYVLATNRDRPKR